MSGKIIHLTFYHSAICRRCHFTGLALGRILRQYPDVELRRVEFLTNRTRARSDGVRSIPALVAQGRSLTGFVLTKGRIERFLESLSGAAAKGE